VGANSAPRARLVPTVTLRVPEEASAAFGVSVDFFREHIAPELAIIRRGRLRLVAVAELERWALAAGERLPEFGGER
jgi:hypothetical protein